MSCFKALIPVLASYIVGFIKPGADDMASKLSELSDTEVAPTGGEGKNLLTELILLF